MDDKCQPCIEIRVRLRLDRCGIVGLANHLGTDDDFRSILTNTVFLRLLDRVCFFFIPNQSQKSRFIL